MENYTHNDELQHWGIKGQKWGQRRYQNKDGSLTELGKKRYNQEVAKLKDEEAKIKAAEKVAANKKKTQSKLDKLDAKKAELEERKKKLKNGDVDDPDKKVETDAERKARVLKSTDPKEVYANKDLLTYNELSERVNRIDLEYRLQGKIPADPKEPTVMDRVEKTTNAINKATGLYKSVDNAFATVVDSKIGKTLANQLGIELPKKEKTFNLDDFVKNINKKSAAEIKEVKERLGNEDDIIQKYNKRKNKEKADADYAAKQAKEKKDAEAREKEVKKNSSESKGKESKNASETREQETSYAKTDGKVYGEGTSRYSGGSKGPTVNAEYGRDYWDAAPSSSSVKTSNMTNTSSYGIGQNYIAGYLGYKED